MSQTMIIGPAFVRLRRLGDRLGFDRLGYDGPNHRETGEKR
jgi:hypothetical protein